MKRIVIVLSLILLPLLLAFGYMLYLKSKVPTVKVGETTFEVEIADTEEERMKGLSGRESLEEKRGMFFVFKENSTPSFWMKGMLIPLDIIWINDGKVIQINENVPPSAIGTLDSNLKLYTAKEPIDYVLEINAGESKSIKSGDLVELKL